MRLALLVLFTCAACAPPPGAVEPGCNPLLGDDCLSPFPSSIYEAPDPASPTGVRLALPAGALPVQTGGVPISAARYEGRDGFSPATSFVVYFQRGVDPSALPGEDQVERSLDPDAPVQLYRMPDGERVPLWAELDQNALPGERQGLLIHPAVRLAPAARYVVALVGLRDPTGAPLEAAPFRALRDGAAAAPPLEALRPRYQELFAFLEARGLARERLTLAWDVHTASDAPVTGRLIAMRDETLARADAGELGYRVTGMDSREGNAWRYRTVDLELEVPSYLAASDGRAPLHLVDGRPTVRATERIPVRVVVPPCAKERPGPLPLVVFGTGLFLDVRETLGYSSWQALAQDLCVVFAGTNWIGLSAEDVATVIDVLATDLNGLYVVIDRLQQAQVNTLAMTRMLLRSIKDDPALAVDGHPAFDGSEVYYYGISNGGIQGTTLLALSPDITRGVLNVPGCNWSLMLYRSTNFNGLRPIVAGRLPDPLDQQLVFTLTQSEWDYVDAVTFARHVARQPLPGHAARPVLVQESIGDAQVPNEATRILVRELGVPALAPLIEPVPGVEARPAPLAAGYVQWDSGIGPLPPPGNTALPTDNGAHNAVWYQGLPTDQVRAFYRPDGQVLNPCEGPCLLY
jgi:hypothetical protein